MFVLLNDAYSCYNQESHRPDDTKPAQTAQTYFATHTKKRKKKKCLRAREGLTVVIERGRRIGTVAVVVFASGGALPLVSAEQSDRIRRFDSAGS